MYLKSITLIALLATCENLYSQGCSDAGICSAGGMFESDTIVKNEMRIGTVFGAGEFDTQYVSPYISYARNLNDRFSLAIKITASVADGSFGTRGSISDAYLNSEYKLKSASKVKWNITAGLKIPFNSANLKINDHALPMDYQLSLGTFDIIAGTNVTIKNWNFNAAVQIPFWNINRNSYFSEYSGTNEFQSTNMFERKSDALFRSSYKLTYRKLTFTPNLLFIYHLGNDSYENIYGQRTTIEGSEGLTLNGNLITSWEFMKDQHLDLSIASPFVVREVRPDGLTRKYTAGIAYRISF